MYNNDIGNGTDWSEEELKSEGFRRHGFLGVDIRHLSISVF